MSAVVTDKRKDELRNSTSFWPELRNQLVDLDPEYFDAFDRFRNAVLADLPLDPKTRILIAIALDVSVTHLYRPGIEKLIDDAIGAGVTTTEVMAAVKLATLLSSHSITESVPALWNRVHRSL